VTRHRRSCAESLSRWRRGSTADRRTSRGECPTESGTGGAEKGRAGTAQRLAAEELIAEISARFVRCTPAEAPDRIPEALALLGDFTGADVSGMGLFSGEGSTIERIYKWHAGMRPSALMSAVWIWRDSPGPSICSRRAERFQVSSQSPLPPKGAAVSRLLESLGWPSIVCVPLFLEGRLAGFLSFGSASTDMRWDEAELAFLRVAGELFIHALERARIDPSWRSIGPALPRQSRTFAYSPASCWQSARRRNEASPRRCTMKSDRWQ